MADRPTPLKTMISGAGDGAAVIDIMKAEGLLSELGLSEADLLVIRIDYIKNQKDDDLSSPGPTDLDLIQRVFRNEYLSEKGRQFSDPNCGREQFEEAHQKNLFYNHNGKTICRRCSNEVRADSRFCGRCGYQMKA